MELIGEQFKQKMFNFVSTNAQPITLGILVIVCVIIGIMLMTGKKNRQGAAEWIPWILIGAGVALSALTIVTAIANAAAF